MLNFIDNKSLKTIHEEQPEQTRFQEFDRTRLDIKSLSERLDKLILSDILPIKPRKPIPSEFLEIASRIKIAKASGASIILMMGAHVIRSGVQRYIIDLMEQGYISCVAMNGAGMIHDFEFAMQGSTTENVEENIKEGRFGLWEETGSINTIISEAADFNLGSGEAVGKAIINNGFPYQDISILASGYRLNIPVTVHIGIGYDIVHELPNCDGAAFGATSYTDFLRFTRIMEFLEGGVVMNFGSAVMAPEIYLKALSMVRNVAGQEKRSISQFATLVCDLVHIPDNYEVEPTFIDPLYYFRPWKTMLLRTVNEGGKSYYVRGNHSNTIPQLWTAVCHPE